MRSARSWPASEVPGSVPLPSFPTFPKNNSPPPVVLQGPSPLILGGGERLGQGGEGHSVLSSPKHSLQGNQSSLLRAADLLICSGGCSAPVASFVQVQGGCNWLPSVQCGWYMTSVFLVLESKNRTQEPLLPITLVQFNSANLEHGLHAGH